MPPPPPPPPPQIPTPEINQHWLEIILLNMYYSFFMCNLHEIFFARGRDIFMRT